MEEFLQKLREQAIYFKVESEPKFGGGVGIDDVLQVLENLKKSYAEFVQIEYDRINTETNKTKLKRIKEGLLEENSLVIVDLNFSSFASAIAPNFLTYSYDLPSISNPQAWKTETFRDYKSLAVESNYNDDNFLAKVEKRFSPEQRKRIFDPLVNGMLKRKGARISFRVGLNEQLKALSQPKQKSVDILSPKLNKEVFAIEPRTSMARVEIRGQVMRPKVLELYDGVDKLVIGYEKIVGSDRMYELKYPVYCEMNTEDGMCLLENKQFGLYAAGKTREEAEAGFFEEFEFILNRYNSLPDSQLTDDVINIKRSLNSMLV